MKKVFISLVILIFSFAALANTMAVNPSSDTSSMNSTPSTLKEETSTSKTKKDSVHQEPVVKSPEDSKIEAQEEEPVKKMNMNRHSGATTEPVE